MHIYEVRPRKDKRGFDLISDALPFGRLWYGEPDAGDMSVTETYFSDKLLTASGEPSNDT